MRNGCAWSHYFMVNRSHPIFLACLYLEHNLPVLKTITKQVHIVEVKLDVCFLCLLWPAKLNAEKKGFKLSTVIENCNL